MSHRRPALAASQLRTSRSPIPRERPIPQFYSEISVSVEDFRNANHCASAAWVERQSVRYWSTVQKTPVSISNGQAKAQQRSYLLTDRACLHTNWTMPGRLQLPETFTLRQALRAGLSKREVYRRRDAGELEVVGRGLFRVAGADLGTSDLAEVAARAPRATLCLSTALSRHDLSDEIPRALDVALPRGTRPPLTEAAVQWHVFDAATFDIGREALVLSDTMSIGIYSPERCIVDVFRLRAREGSDVAIEALKRWLRRRGSQPAKLLEVASHFPRASGPIRRALEILL